MKNILVILFFLLSYFNLLSQELFSNSYMKGHIKDNKKVSMWEYYDENGELEIKINYDNGNIYFLKKDTTDFVIFKDGNWVKQKLKIYPMPIEGFNNFRRSLAQRVFFPIEARERRLEGKVIVTFDIDTLGEISNYKLIKDIGGGCGDAVILALKEIKTVWLTAQEKGKVFKSRFYISVYFNFGKNKSTDDIDEAPLAKEIPEIQITAFGYTGVNKTSFYSVEDALKFKRTAKKLSITNKGLDKIPKEIGLLKNLISLDLEKNQITKLPIEMSSLKHLDKLYLPYNKLKEIPTEIISIKNLRILGLSTNEFVDFPTTICELTKIETLDLSYNKIKEIPSSIGKLKNLRFLFLQGNDISDLPNEIFKLKKLEVINLKDNSFSQDSIDKIKSLFKKDIKLTID